jgi:hypothetical protein
MLSAFETANGGVLDVTTQVVTKLPTTGSIGNDVEFNGNRYRWNGTTYVNDSTGFSRSFSSWANMKLIDYAKLVDGDVVKLSGYYSYRDGGEGDFVWEASSSATDNGGTILNPTGNPGNGRLRRLRGENLTVFKIKWYGAITSNGSLDTALVRDANAAINGPAIDAAILDVRTSKVTTQGINWLDFDVGFYWTNKGHTCDRTEVAFLGGGGMNCRLIHTPSATGPVLYLSGRSRTSAAPYGGLKGITLSGNAGTFPACLYIDDSIDNMFKLEDLATGGGAAGCDGISVGEWLNAHFNVARNDACSGYMFRIRGGSANFAAPSSTTGSTDTSASGFPFRSLTFNTVTGLITISKGPENIAMPKGSGITFLTKGTLPTDAGTGLPLKGVNAAVGAGMYFIGDWDYINYGFRIYYTQADAIAGTNPISFSDVGVGQHGAITACTTFLLSASSTTDEFTYTSRNNVMIPTTVVDGTTTYIGNGFTTTGRIDCTGVGHVLLYAEAGASLPAPLSPGVIYYPIWSAYNKFKVASTAANAAAGIAINLTDAGSGNFYVMYNHAQSTGGIGALEINQMTYDNSNATTTTTTNGVARGGRGLLFAWPGTGAKGQITIRGHRFEINKMLDGDPVFGLADQARIIRIWGMQNAYFAPQVKICLEAIQFDLSASFQVPGYAKMIGLLGNNGDWELDYEIRNCQTFGIGLGYNNDSGTAKGYLPIVHTRARILRAQGYAINTASPLRIDNSIINTDEGVSRTRYAAAQFANSFVKAGDLLLSDDVATAYYKVTNTTPGLTTNTGAVSIGATVTGTTVAGNLFTLSGTPSVDNFCVGAAVSIAGAGAAAAALTGIVGAIDIISTPKTFRLLTTTGLPQPCVTDVTGVACTFLGATIASVPVFYEVSAAFSVTNLAAGTSTTATINAPTGVTFAASAPIEVGYPSNVQANLIYKAFVTAGGASITLQCFNPTAGNVTQASGTFKYLVRA